jgi:hypothetical protein
MMLWSGGAGVVVGFRLAAVDNTVWTAADITLDSSVLSTLTWGPYTHEDVLDAALDYLNNPAAWRAYSPRFSRGQPSFYFSREFTVRNFSFHVILGIAVSKRHAQVFFYSKN